MRAFVHVGIAGYGHGLPTRPGPTSSGSTESRYDPSSGVAGPEHAGPRRPGDGRGRGPAWYVPTRQAMWSSTRRTAPTACTWSCPAISRCASSRRRARRRCSTCSALVPRSASCRWWRRRGRCGVGDGRRARRGRDPRAHGRGGPRPAGAPGVASGRGHRWPAGRRGLRHHRGRQHADGAGQSPARVPSPPGSWRRAPSRCSALSPGWSSKPSRSWGMSTPPAHARRGYGRAVLDSVLAAGVADGARTGVLGATPAGLPLYEATGWASSSSGTRSPTRPRYSSTTPGDEVRSGPSGSSGPLGEHPHLVTVCRFPSCWWPVGAVAG
jgi:hypothetical protein